MSDAWQLQVYDQQELVCTVELNGPAELGRESSPDESLYSHRALSGRRRVVIANKDETTVSRRHVLLEPLAEGGFRLTNLSAERRINLSDGSDVAPQASRVVATDVLLALGGKTIRLQKRDHQLFSLHSLAKPTVPPGKRDPAALSLVQVGAARIEVEALAPWLEAIIDLLESAASTADFFAKAARAVVDLINLDSGRVLFWNGQDWQTHSLSTSPRRAHEATPPVSGTVLATVLREKRTFWETPNPALPAGASLSGVAAVVAAPVLDRNGAVIGALYGDRRQANNTRADRPVTEWEAMLVEVLARGVAAGLARLEQEQAALAARVQFEQFFSPELARQLSRQPNLLEGRDVEVTVLFCDIRGFSRISERLGPAPALQWINDVLGALSDCVRTQGGVLVDYVGDELLAMWGAPEAQPDHARRACSAALAMLAMVPQLNDRWQTVLQEPFRIGIGIHTGLARVGNTGSRHKFKYGPLGNTVNLGSRVQGATKYLKCSALITGATEAQLAGSFATRRLCQVRVLNIRQPVTLHELVAQGRSSWPEAKLEYEKALAEFETGNFAKVAQILGNWREQHPDDAPAVLLLYRAVHCLVEETLPFDPVWTLPGK
jgi:adenylate cyclase